MKECVPITAVTKTFPYFHKNETVTGQQKQFPLKLGQAITVHNFQGSTLEYTKIHFHCLSKNGKSSTAVPINLGVMYAIPSCAKIRLKLKFVNFESEHIEVNTGALKEIHRIREEALISWHKPLVEISETKLSSTLWS